MRVDCFKAFLALSVSLFAWPIIGCKTDDGNIEGAPRFFLSQGQSGGFDGSRSMQVPLPGKNNAMVVGARPVLTEFDFRGVKVVEVEMGRALMFGTTASGRYKLMRLTTPNIGKRLLLVVDGEPIGVRVIDGSLQDGILFTFVFAEDEEIFTLAERIDRAIRQANR
jgi:hypothetical protein